MTTPGTPREPQEVYILSELTVSQLREKELSDRHVNALCDSHELLRQKLELLRFTFQVSSTDEEVRLRAELAALTQTVQAQGEELTDWILVADGVKHDWRCCHGEAGTALCLRCQLEGAESEALTVNNELSALRQQIADLTQENSDLRAKIGGAGQ